MKSSGRTHINDYPEILREQALLGELPVELQQEIEASQGFGEFRTLRVAEDMAILTKHTPQEMIPRIHQKASQTKRNSIISAIPAFTRLAWAAIPVAAVLLAVLLIVQPFRGQGDENDITRIKGNAQDALNVFNAELPTLEIWKQTGNQAEPLKSGAQVKAFDSLQIAYRAMGRRFGMIISLDGNSKMTLHFPESFTASTLLRPGNAVVLPYAYQLDNAPRFERFFFITSRVEFNVTTIWSLVERQLGGKDVPPSWAMEAALNLDPGFEASSFLLRK